MDKKYTDFMDEISSDELYEGLLAYGLFAEKLPPVFTSVPFFNYCKTRSEEFKLNMCWNEYITFRVMRNISIPRLMGIPNPFRYQMLCAELKNDWDQLRTHFHKQTDGQNYRVSRIHVRKEYDSKRIFEMNYKNWRTDGNPELDLLIHNVGKSNDSSRVARRFIVQTDISTCFASVYTHSIPWALAGKNIAKQEIKESDQLMETALHLNTAIKELGGSLTAKETETLDSMLELCRETLAKEVKKDTESQSAKTA